MNKLRIGIIGLGIGEKHLQAYNASPFCEVVSLCDFSEEKLREFKKIYPSIITTTKASDILRDKKIDVVSIASYDNYHYRQVSEALKNDKHVFVEKPLCLYRKEALKIRQILEKRPHLKLSSNLILRRSPRFQLIKDMIRDAKFGDIYYIEGDYNYGRLNKLTDGWRGDIDLYSVIYGGGVHIVDLILWMAGSRVEEVFSYGNRIATKNTKFKHDDLSVSLLKFEKGLIAKVTSNFSCVLPHFHNLSIYGTKATFINDFEYGRFITSRNRQDKAKKITAGYDTMHKGDLIANFIGSILKKEELEVTAEDVFKVMSVCFSMQESAQKAKRIKVEYV